MGWPLWSHIVLWREQRPMLQKIGQQGPEGLISQESMWLCSQGSRNGFLWGESPIWFHRQQFFLCSLDITYFSALERKWEGYSGCPFLDVHYGWGIPRCSSELIKSSISTLLTHHVWTLQDSQGRQGSKHVLEDRFVTVAVLLTSAALGHMYSMED